MSAVNLFISYSHEDESWRKRLVDHLGALDVAKDWCDRDVLPGDAWKEKINNYLSEAHVILLLISSDFWASDYCQFEMSRAIERHKKDGTKVIPIRLRPFDWKGTPISEFQALPKDAVPVSKWADPDDAFENVTMGIRVIVEQILEAKKDTESIQPSPPSDDSESTLRQGSQSPVEPDRRSQIVQRINQITGRAFISYRRTRVDEIALLIAALHDRGVPTWDDLSNLDMGQTEESLRKVLADPVVSSGILWLTPDVADSAMIRKVEMPELLNRARNDDSFFALLVAAGRLDYNGVAELGKGYVPYDLGEFNISKVAGDPIDHLEAAKVARLVLRQRIEKLHRHLPPDEPLVVNIYTGTPPPFQAGKALTIDWTQRFVGGRTALPGAWEDFLLPALKDIVEAIQTQAPERAVEITGLLSLPGAVALGSIFLEPRGIKISWRPRQSTNQLWNINEPRETSGFVSALSSDALTGEDLAMLVSVDNNVSSAFTRSKPHLGVEFRAVSEVINPGLAPGVTRSEISTPGEAADIAYIVRQAIITARNQYSEIRRTHLFVAAPVGLAMMIGQLMNTCGMIQTYEFNADNHDCPYQPTVLLNPTW